MNGVLKRLLVWLLRPVAQEIASLIRPFMEDVAWDVVNSEENEIDQRELIKKAMRS